MLYIVALLKKILFPTKHRQGANKFQYFFEIKILEVYIYFSYCYKYTTEQPAFNSFKQ